MSEAEIIELCSKHRRRMDEINAKDLSQTQALTRAHNLSIYLAGLGKDEKSKLRPHAIELMLRGLVGETPDD